MSFSVKDIVVIASCISVIFVQEQLFSILPNIQLTIFLLVLYSKKLGFIKTSIIVLIHSLLDCIVTGSLNVYYFPFMLVGWLFVPIIICIFFKKVESPFVLALMGVVFSLLYSWIYIIPNVLIPNEALNKISFLNYLAADYLFEVLLSASSFLSILWLYTPCSKIFEKLLKEINT